MNLKYDAMGIIEKAVKSLSKKSRHDKDTAFVLAEFANNLAQVMNGESTVEDFKNFYVGWETKLDMEKLFP